MSKNNVMLVSVDDGSSQVKLAWKFGGKLKTKIVSSRACAGIGHMPENEQCTALTINGSQTFHVPTNPSDALENNIQEFQTSALSAFAVHNALIEAGFGGCDVSICVTLPIASFYSSTVSGGITLNHELIAKKRDNLLNSQITSFDERRVTANIVDVTVYCESKPAFFTLMFDDDMNARYKYQDSDRFAVIDIGDTTTDVVQFGATGVIERNNYKSIPLGVSNVRKDLKSELEFKHKLMNLPFGIVDVTLKTGNTRISGSDHDGSEQLQTVRAEHFNSLIIQINNVLPNPNMFYKIFVVGGGASLFKEHFESWQSNVVIPKGNETTLAEGILKTQEFRNSK